MRSARWWRYGMTRFTNPKSHRDDKIL
jgi:hypothetical protein